MTSSTHHAPPSEKEAAAVAFLKANVKGKLLDDDRHFSLQSDSLLLRFVRQKEGHPEKALALLESAIEWRNRTKPHQITFQEVQDYSLLNVFRVQGFTKRGVPIAYYIAPKKSIPLDPEYQMRFSIFFHEELMRRGYDECVIITDYEDGPTVPSASDRKVQELSDELGTKYYPFFESKIFLCNFPMVLRPLLAISIAFMCEAQKNTLKSSPKPKHFLEVIDAAVLPKKYGGEAANLVVGPFASVEEATKNSFPPPAKGAGEGAAVAPLS